jgi:hypothetical protein
MYIVKGTGRPVKPSGKAVELYIKIMSQSTGKTPEEIKAEMAEEKSKHAIIYDTKKKFIEKKAKKQNNKRRQ